MPSSASFAVAAAVATALFVAGCLASPAPPIPTDGPAGMPLDQVFDGNCFAYDKYGYNHPVFNETTISTIRLYLPGDELHTLLTDLSSRTYLSADLEFTGGNVNVTYNGIGIRLRGYASRYNVAKKSFTLKLTKNKNPSLYGVDKIALRAEAFDPSLLRESMVFDSFRAMGVCTQRKSYAGVYINGEFWGLYLMAEIIDESFVGANWGSSEIGNLYKLAHVDLSYHGEQFVEPLLFAAAGTPLLKTNKKGNDYSNLFALIRDLHTLPGDDVDVLAAELAARISVPALLRALAVDVAAWSWDDYWSNQNNYYLYYVPNTNRFYYIPQDEDLVWGTAYLPDRPCANRTVYTWACPEGVARPLVDRVLEVPAFRALYTFYLDATLKFMLSDAFSDHIVKTYTFIENIAQVPYANKSESIWPTDGFHLSLESTIIGYIPTIMTNISAPGLFDYNYYWAMNATAQLDPLNDTVAIERAWVSAPVVTTSTAAVTAIVHHTNGTKPSATLYYAAEPYGKNTPINETLDYTAAPMQASQALSGLSTTFTLDLDVSSIPTGYVMWYVAAAAGSATTTEPVGADSGTAYRNAFFRYAAGDADGAQNLWDALD